jgi:Xaa-Pro dipeptidase
MLSAMALITDIQQAIREEGLEGWLFYDHHRRDPIAYRVLGLPTTTQVTRRWYYFVPASGEPRKLAHRIEPHSLDALPGAATFYSTWSSLRGELQRLIGGVSPIAMQHSPDCAIPYVALVDAGTIDLVRSFGIDVRSSANLVERFEAVLTPEGYRSHKEAGVKVDAIRSQTFAKVAEALRAGARINEYEVQQFIMRRFNDEGLVCDHGPIVGINAHASDPHYDPSAEASADIRLGDLLLIDLWAKLDRPGAIYYDITWTGYCGAAAPDAMKSVFAIVSGARDAAIRRVQTSVAYNESICGYHVDDAARAVIEAAGYGDFFFHRTGHSIGEEVHGNGANMDNYETHDERRIIPGLLFSVEPGVYLPEFGIRSEVNVYRGDGTAEVTGEIQTALLELLA